MKRGLLLLSCLSLVLLMSCSRPMHVVSTAASGGTVRIEARSFAFEPDVIKAAAGQSLSLDVVNTSGHEHNITIKDPAGEVIVSEDIPAGKTARVTIVLNRPGQYAFFCNKPFHSSLGMFGSIETQ